MQQYTNYSDVTAIKAEALITIWPGSWSGFNFFNIGLNDGLSRFRPLAFTTYKFSYL